jgi:NDP-sugar pyrophosphorylase family protein
MKDLTLEMPKPMLKVLGRPVLDHIGAALPDEIEEIILVVGYHETKIREYCGEVFWGRPVRYATQEDLNGTGGALWRAKDLLHDRFLVMNGDDICTREDLEACVHAPDWALLALEVDDLGSAGKVIVDDHNCAVEILEKEAHSGGPGYANTNLFALDTRVFNYPPIYRQGSTTEFGLPQTVMQAAHDVPIHVISAHTIIRLTDPEDIPAAEKKLLETGTPVLA